MKIFERLFHSLGFIRTSRLCIPIQPDLIPALEKMAVQEGKSVEGVAQELLFFAVAESKTAGEKLQLWEELTPREKQTAALACLGCTNHEIAERMIISPNTVKTHVRHILNKFNAKSKAELRTVLMDWDFSAWIAEQDLGPNSEPPPTYSDSSDGVTP